MKVAHALVLTAALSASGGIRSGRTRRQESQNVENTADLLTSPMLPYASLFYPHFVPRGGRVQPDQQESAANEEYRTFYGTEPQKFEQFIDILKIEAELRKKAAACNYRRTCMRWYKTPAPGVNEGETGQLISFVASHKNTFAGAAANGLMRNNCTETYPKCDEYIRIVTSNDTERSAMTFFQPTEETEDDDEEEFEHDENELFFRDFNPREPVEFHHLATNIKRQGDILPSAWDDQDFAVADGHIPNFHIGPTSESPSVTGFPINPCEFTQPSYAFGITTCVWQELPTSMSLRFNNRFKELVGLDDDGVLELLCQSIEYRGEKLIRAFVSEYEEENERRMFLDAVLKCHDEVVTSGNIKPTRQVTFDGKKSPSEEKSSPQRRVAVDDTRESRRIDIPL